MKRGKDRLTEKKRRADRERDGRTDGERQRQRQKMSRARPGFTENITTFYVLNL